MHRNGHPTIRVLLTGAAAEELAGALAQEPTLSMVRPAGGGGDFRIPMTVDVALHVIDHSTPDVANEIGQIRAASQAPLILAAYGEPNGIVETGLRVGAADVLVLPQPMETLLFALRKAAIARSTDAATRGTIVTVFSPKGGSGKTVLATNLAVAAQRSGLSTLLVDLDLQFGDAALTLAIPPRATIADLASSSGDIDVDKLKAFVCTDSRSSLSVLAAPKRPEEAQVVGQAELAGALDAARAAYSAVVVDTGPLFDAAMLAALDRTDRLLLICNPEVTSLKNVRIGLETIDRLGFPRERVDIIANRIGAAGGVSRSEIEEALEAPVAFELPDDPTVPAAINRATPVLLAEPSSRFSRSVISLTKSVFAETPVTATTPAASQRRSLLRGRR
jgi:Flp pilus assembly CpaE family ATPase